MTTAAGEKEASKKKRNYRYEIMDIGKSAEPVFSLRNSSSPVTQNNKKSGGLWRGPGAGQLDDTALAAQDSPSLSLSPV